MRVKVIAMPSPNIQPSSKLKEEINLHQTILIKCIKLSMGPRKINKKITSKCDQVRSKRQHINGIRQEKSSVAD